MRQSLLVFCLGLFISSAIHAPIPLVAEEDRLRGIHLPLTAGINLTNIENLFRSEAGLALNKQVYLTLGVRGYISVTDQNPETRDTSGLLVGKLQNRALGLHLTLNYMLSRRP